jgi:Spy/CpxP family protein refolding chaperone
VKVKRLSLVLLLVALAAPIWAAPDLPDGKWWKRPRLAEEIGLTPAQQDQIEEIFVKSRSKLIDLRADLEKKQLALQVAMEDRAADRREIEKKIESLENARAELQKTRALMFLDMKLVLRQEQWDKLLQRHEELRERRQEIRERMRDRIPGPGRKPDRQRPNPSPNRRPG